MTRRLGRPVPYATGLVNLTGALVIGFLADLVDMQRLRLTTEGRAFLFVGILGGFTTFSTFALDTLTLARAAAPAAALANVLAQAGFGLIAVYVGFLIGGR